MSWPDFVLRMPFKVRPDLTTDAGITRHGWFTCSIAIRVDPSTCSVGGLVVMPIAALGFVAALLRGYAGSQGS